ncbi:exodeoxyribonuclease VII large subunit [Carboxylicivirga sp. N1Y90]|uniref:exodeoxyribonuclease VII large subunit n=1 Tax=Carboxylicivirga fragile TaxID=3417571 RepID=UPI003D3425B5|nr:exodeoxyribonuclease VII large subunit [Marinilabiliaceae bacterium N1Y90]
MAEQLTLLQLNEQVKNNIKRSFPDTYWVIAEISEIRTVRSGHCYIELIEKDEESDNIVAKSRATIWAFTYRMLKPYFETSTKQQLESGLKILVKVSIEFQEVYGFSLNIKDIDPSYTLGDIAKKKLDIIRQLEEEGVIDMNKEVELTALPQKLAIISSPTAAGYEDFINQLNNNPSGFKIYHHLFTAIMQGNDAEQSIISALERIYEHEATFDAVILIRGGGSTADLMCFDSYVLAINIAQFPLPIITGIGHERDESIADLVAHTKLKTPTAVAEFIIDRFENFKAYLDDLQGQIINITQQQLASSKHQLELATSALKPLVSKILLKQKRKPVEAAQRLSFSVKSYFETQHSNFSHIKESILYQTKKQVQVKTQKCEFQKAQLKLELASFIKNKQQQLILAEKTNALSSPENILKKGYSISYKNNKPIKGSKGLVIGDEIYTQLKEGSFISRIEKLND